VEPEFIIEAHRVDDQRVSLILADGFAIPRRIRIWRVLAPIHEDLPVAVYVAFEKYVSVIPVLKNGPWIGSQAGHAGGQAICFGIVLRWTLLGELQRPRLYRKLLAFLQRIANVKNEMKIGPPDP